LAAFWSVVWSSSQQKAPGGYRSTIAIAAKVYTKIGPLGEGFTTEDTEVHRGLL